MTSPTTMIGGFFAIPPPNVHHAFQAVRALNRIDSWKQSRTTTPDGSTVPCYTGMTADYDTTCTTLSEVMEMVGFVVTSHFGNDVELSYHPSRTSQADLFLMALAPWAAATSLIEWEDSNGRRWANGVHEEHLLLTHIEDANKVMLVPPPVTHAEHKSVAGCPSLYAITSEVVS